MIATSKKWTVAILARTNRIEVIDSLRGIAVLAVLLFHYTYRWGPLHPDKFDLYHFTSNTAAFALGWLGVELFFVVSGFVIFMTLERCTSWRDFAIRRFARLYPPYIFAMMLTFLFTTAFGPVQFHSTLRELIAGLTMASPYLGYDWVDGVYWSLLVELKFYFWISLLYFVLPGRFMIASLGFGLLTVALPFLPHIPGQSFLLGDFAPFFFAGMAYYLRFKRCALDLWSGGLLFIAAISYIELWQHREVAVHAIVIAIAAAFELFLAGKLSWLQFTRLQSIGLISYSLYLIHQCIGVTMIGWLDRSRFLNGIPAVLIVTGIVMAAAFVMYQYIEAPSHRIVRIWANHALALWRTRLTSDTTQDE